MEEIAVNVGLCVLAFIIGRVVQKWADGTMEAEEDAYQVGYKEGHDAGYREGQRAGWAWGQRTAPR